MKAFHPPPPPHTPTSNGGSGISSPRNQAHVVDLQMQSIAEDIVDVSNTDTEQQHQQMPNQQQPGMNHVNQRIGQNAKEHGNNNWGGIGMQETSPTARHRKSGLSSTTCTYIPHLIATTGEHPSLQNHHHHQGAFLLRTSQQPTTNNTAAYIPASIYVTTDQSHPHAHTHAQQTQGGLFSGVINGGFLGVTATSANTAAAAIGLTQLQQQQFLPIGYSSANTGVGGGHQMECGSVHHPHAQLFYTQQQHHQASGAHHLLHHHHHHPQQQHELSVEVLQELFLQVTNFLSLNGVSYRVDNGVVVVEHQGVKLQIVIGNFQNTPKKIQMRYIAGDARRFETLCTHLASRFPSTLINVN